MSFKIWDYAEQKQQCGLLTIAKRVRYEHSGGQCGVIVQLPDGSEHYITQSCHLDRLAPWPPSQVSPVE